MPLNLTAIAELKARIAQAVEDEATNILHVAQERIPVETGTAKASGKVVTDQGTVWVSFGADDDGSGSHAPSNQYIEVLEEDGERHHPHGQAHFLRSAGDDAVAGLAERVATKARLG